MSWLRNLQYQKTEKKHKEEEKTHEEATAEEEQEALVPLITQIDNNLHSTLSNVEVYINFQQLYNSNGLNAHKSDISNNFKVAIFENKGVLHCTVNDYEEFPDEITEALLCEHFFNRRMKMLSKTDGFMLYDKLGVNFFSASELLNPNMRIELQQIRARPNFYMISDNPNNSPGIVDC